MKLRFILAPLTVNKRQVVDFSYSLDTGNDVFRLLGE